MIPILPTKGFAKRVAWYVVVSVTALVVILGAQVVQAAEPERIDLEAAVRWMTPSAPAVESVRAHGCVYRRLGNALRVRCPVLGLDLRR